MTNLTLKDAGEKRERKKGTDRPVPLPPSSFAGRKKEGEAGEGNLLIREGDHLDDRFLHHSVDRVEFGNE